MSRIQSNTLQLKGMLIFSNTGCLVDRKSSNSTYRGGELQTRVEICSPNNLCSSFWAAKSTTRILSSDIKFKANLLRSIYASFSQNCHLRVFLFFVLFFLLFVLKLPQLYIYILNLITAL